MADIEQLGDALELRRIRRKSAHAPAVIEIGRNTEVREQASLLEHVADASAMCRHVNAALGIEQDGVIEHDAAVVRRDQAGDNVGERGLAGAGGTEQYGDAARGVEARLHGKIAEPLFHVEREHPHSPWKRVPARRASHSAAISAASEMAIATNASRPAAASPPGI